jgi:hypothetical protein
VLRRGSIVAARVDVSAIVAAPSQALDGLPDINADATLAEITSVADAAGSAMRGASELAQDVLRSLGNLQNLAGMAANLALPAECLNGIREVAWAARVVLDAGDRIFETVSAVAALPYTLTDAGRLGDIVFILRENLLHTRDTARLTGYGMDGVQRGLAATGRTLERLPDRIDAAEHCLSVSDQAGRVPVWWTRSNYAIGCA